MKKIFAFAMAIVSMAAVMTSCSNDDTDFIEKQAPVARNQEQTKQEQAPEENNKFDGNIYFCAYPEQIEAMNVAYEVSTEGGNTATIKVERLQVAKQYPEDLVKQFVQFDRLGKSHNDSFREPVVYVYNIPSEIKGEISITPKFTVKKDFEINGTIDAVCGVSTTSYNRVNFYEVTNENVEQFLNQANGQNFKCKGL